MKRLALLFLFCFGFLVSATSNNIDKTPYYWVETVGFFQSGKLTVTTPHFSECFWGANNTAKPSCAKTVAQVASLDYAKVVRGVNVTSNVSANSVKFVGDLPAGLTVVVPNNGTFTYNLTMTNDRTNPDFETWGSAGAVNLTFDGNIYPQTGNYEGNLTLPAINAPYLNGTQTVFQNCLLFAQGQTFAATAWVQLEVSSNGTDYIRVYNISGTALNNSWIPIAPYLSANSKSIYIRDRQVAAPGQESFSRFTPSNGVVGLNCTLANQSAWNFGLTSGNYNYSANVSVATNNSAIYNVTLNLTNGAENIQVDDRITTTYASQLTSCGMVYPMFPQFFSGELVYTGGVVSNVNATLYVNNTPQTFSKIASFNWNTTSQINATGNMTVTWVVADLVNNFFTFNKTYSSLVNSNAAALNFSTVWEENQSAVSTSQQGAFSWSGGNYSSSNVGTSWPVCIYPASAFLSVSSVQSFYNDSAKVRSYYLLNANVTNQTNNVSLLVPDASSQFVLLTVRDNLGSPVSGVYVSFQRQFLASNTYTEVSRVFTSTLGQATTWLRSSGAIYNIVVYNSTNGVISTFNNQNLGCDPAASICSVTIFLDTGITPLAYKLLGATQYSCVTTNSTANCSFIDTSGLSRNFTLLLIKHSSFFDYTVCTASSTSSAGSVFCNATDWTAATSYSYAFYDSAQNNILESGFLPKLEAPVFGSEGAMVVLFIVLTIALIGTWSASTALLLSFLGFAVPYAVGILPSIMYGSVLGFGVVVLIGVARMNS